MRGQAGGQTAGGGFALAIHGGWSPTPPPDLTPEMEADYLNALTESLVAGHEVLATSRSSLDAVVAAIRVMEDCPLFNAGRGAVFTSDGHNELDAIKVARSIVGAQQEYAAASHDGRKAGAYAVHLMSLPGTHDGLYWPAAGGEVPSPAGPLLAQAGSEGYDTSGVRVPYHGYYYRMLANGTGFGFVAYPADYHESGIMTFQVSETGVVYQKDLGDTTSALVQAMTVYQVDSTWAVVPADE